MVIVQEKVSYGIVGTGLIGFFADVQGAPLAIEFHNAVSFGIIDPISEDQGAAREPGGLLKSSAHSETIEDVIAEDETDRAGTHKRFSENECLGKPFGAGLFDVFEGKSPLGTVIQEVPEKGKVPGRGNDQNFPDSGQHQDRKRVINHRLVVHGQQLLADRPSGRI